MPQGFFSRPLGLWLLTLAVAVVLLGLGYNLARQGLEPQLKEAKEQLAAERSRANQLAALNQSLEARLDQAEAGLSQRPAPPPRIEEPPSRPEPEPPGEGDAPASRVLQLHRGEAAVLLDGQLVLTLEGFSQGRRQAQLTVRLAGGQESPASLAPGGELRLRLGERSYRLLVRKIVSNSIVYSLLPLEAGPRPRREP